jgi:Ca2+-binding RTX toxin-like protein
LAKVTAYSALNMENAKVWYGAVQSYNASSITLAAGAREATYEGNFTYDADGSVFGQLKGFTQSFNGNTTVEVDGIRANAYTVFIMVNNNNALGAYEYCLRFADTIVGSAGTDVLLGFAGGDRINGQGSADVLKGMDGQDTLLGGNGSDRLIGGYGADVMDGGKDSNRDVFVFVSSKDTGSSGSTRDRIVNFDRGEDVIDLQKFDLKFSNKAAVDSVWVATGQFGAVVHIDLDGDGRSDKTFAVSGVSGLGANDFLL